MKFNTTLKTVLAFLVIALITLVIAMRFLMPTVNLIIPSTTKSTLNKVSEIEHNLSTTPQTRPVYDKGFFYVTPNYTSFYNKNNEVVWNEIFNLNNVQIANKENYLATAQYNVNSSTIYVFNTTGLVYTIQPNRKILKHTINKNGYLGLIYAEGSGYQIQTYDGNGNKILTYTFAEKNSIPVDVSISGDNKYLAIPFFNYDGLTPISKTTFLYLDKNDPNTATKGDAIFAGFNLENTVPFSSMFVNNDLFLISDKKVAKYSISNGIVSESFTIDVNNYIKDISVANNKYIVIAFSEKINNSAELNSNTVGVYNLNGELLSNTDSIDSLDFITISPEGFLVEHNNSLTYYNFKSKPIYTYSVEETISDAYLMNKNLDTIITTSKTGIYEVINAKKDF